MQVRRNCLRVKERSVSEGNDGRQGITIADQRTQDNDDDDDKDNEYDNN